MKNSNIKTINGLGKACSIFCRIAFVFCIIGTIGAIIGGGIVLALPTDFINLNGKADATLTMEIDDPDSAVFSITGSNNGIHINSDKEDISISSDKVEFGDIWSMDVEELSSDGNSATYKLSGDFADIDKKAIKWELLEEIFKAFITVAATGVTLFFASKLFKEFAVCDTPFTESLVNKMKIFGGVMIGYGLITSFNITIVFAGLTVLMLGFVFAHGAELQKQSDETL